MAVQTAIIQCSIVNYQLWYVFGCRVIRIGIATPSIEQSRFCPVRRMNGLVFGHEFESETDTHVLCAWMKSLVRSYAHILRLFRSASSIQFMPNDVCSIHGVQKRISSTLACVWWRINTEKNVSAASNMLVSTIFAEAHECALLNYIIRYGMV